MAYQKVDFWRVALGMALTGVPLFFLEQSNPRWARAYTFVLILGFLVTHYQGVAQAAGYFSQQLGGSQP